MKIHGLLAFTAATAVALPLSLNVDRGTPSPGQYADSTRRSDPAEDFIDATMVEYALAKAPVSEQTKRFDTRDNGVISAHRPADPESNSEWTGRLKPRQDSPDATMVEHTLAKGPVPERTKCFNTRDDEIISTHQSTEAIEAAYLVKRPNYVVRIY
jgi:hypothetical protein